jgi:hypothetical protein
MDQLYLKDSQVFYLNKDVLNNRIQDCELITIFKKPIHLERQMECCLVEIDLPKHLFVKANKTPQLRIILHFEMENFFQENYKDLKLVHPMDPDISILSIDLKSYSTISTNKTNGQQIYDEICKIVEEGMYEMLKSMCKHLFPTSISSTGEPENGVIFERLKCQIIELYDGKTKLSTKVGSLAISKAEPNPQKESIDIGKFWFTFEKELSDLLGLDVYPLEKNNYLVNIVDKDVFFEKIFGIRLSSNDKIYVYSDIIRESFIDNIRTNILRYLPYQLNKSYYSFKHQMFIPLRIEEFNSITVSIRNFQGEVLCFNEGSLCVTLMFRPIEYI